MGTLKCILHVYKNEKYIHSQIMHPWAWSPFHCRMDEYHFCDAFHLQRIKKTSSRQICFDVKNLKEDLCYVVHKLTELKIPPLHELLFLVTQYHKALKKTSYLQNSAISFEVSTNQPVCQKLNSLIPQKKQKSVPKPICYPFTQKP